MIPRIESEVIVIKTPVSRVGNKTAILHILYALFPIRYGRFIDVFGGSGSVLLGNPEICPFEVYNDFDRNLANLFRCMKERTMAVIRELGFCHLNSREDFIAIRRFFENEQFDDKYLSEELRLTQIMFPPPEAKELTEMRKRITLDYDVRRAAMFLKLLRFSYSSSGKSYASQPFDIRRLFGLISQLQDRMANVVVENQDFETLIKHYDRPDAFFYLDPPYFSTEDMYEVGFGWDDHVRLRDTLKNIKGKFLLSYNDCDEIRELYNGFSMFDFSRTHSMAQRYEAGKEFKELLIGNYDLYEREKLKPKQLTIFELQMMMKILITKNSEGVYYSMQNTKMTMGEYVLFSIPVEMLEEAGIGEESVVQMSAGNGKIIINTIKDTEDFICDGDCRHCPMSEMDCDGDCEACPCYESCDEREVF